MKCSLVFVSLLLVCSVAYANHPLRCDNLNDGGGSCNASDDCQDLCATMEDIHSGLNPLTAGLITGFVDRRVVVAGVIPYSPAREAGVRTGDRLVSVDGVRLPAPYGLNSIWQTAGPHRLVVERSGRIVHFSLTPVPEQVILAKAWSEFDPIEEESMRLVGFTQRYHAPLSPPLRKPFLTGIRAVQTTEGLAVQQVLPGSSAEVSGIHKGDIILHSNTKEQSADSRMIVNLTVRRHDKTINFRVRMDSLSEVLARMATKQQNARSAISGSAGF